MSVNGFKLIGMLPVHWSVVLWSICMYSEQLDELKLMS